jgi:hypothetical protein
MGQPSQMEYNTQPMELYTATGLKILIGVLIGYLVGYAKKKGENLATHEDLERVVEQMSAVTTATKAIEAKISSDVWDRQKRWELKREVLFEATKRIADIEDALLSLDSALKVVVKQQKEGVTSTETIYEQSMKWSRASTAFDETKLLVAMVCDKETKDAFEGYGLFALQVATKISPGKDWEIYLKSTPELFKKLLAVRAAVRKELGLEGPA